MKSARAQIESKIEEAVEAALQQIAKADSALLEAVERETDLHLVFNSSFLYRDKRTVKTLQSSRRSITKMAKSGKGVRSDAIGIVEDLFLKAHYRILSPQDVPDRTPIPEAIGQELASVGDLIFVLIGTVKGLRPSAQPIDGEAVKELRLTPSITRDIEGVEAGVYAVRKIVPIEDLLAQISHDFEAQGGLSDTDRRKIAEAYDSLLDDATTDVVIPTTKTVKARETILGRIVDSLRSQTTEYRTALKALHDGSADEQALNEVLRIAYNFSTDVLPLIFLFMSICDLKPVVFWCTIDKQWTLCRAFASLPWSALGRKEKLEEYQAIVSQARNYAFHHILPFEATVEVNLSHLDVRAERIRLFSPFGQKQDRGIWLKDQALADVLADFSRAKQRPVSKLFWEGNLSVMEAVCELAEGILSALLLMHAARTRGR
jgi:hypothetical protein